MYRCLVLVITLFTQDGSKPFNKLLDVYQIFDTRAKPIQFLSFRGKLSRKSFLLAISVRILVQIAFMAFFHEIQTYSQVFFIIL